MDSWVKICNLALSRIGEPDITALDDDTEEAIACNSVYESVVDEVLEMYNWACARSMAILSADSSTPVFKWDYQYPFPSNPYCLRVIKVQDTGETDIEYEIQGRKILCDEEDGIYLQFSKRIVDPAELSPWLSTCIALKLANWIEPRFGDSITRRKSIMDEFAAAVLEAKIAGQCQDWGDDETERGSENKYGNLDWVSAGGKR